MFITIDHWKVQYVISQRAANRLLVMSHWSIVLIYRSLVKLHTMNLFKRTMIIKEWWSINLVSMVSWRTLMDIINYWSIAVWVLSVELTVITRWKFWYKETIFFFKQANLTSKKRFQTIWKHFFFKKKIIFQNRCLKFKENSQREKKFFCFLKFKEYKASI